MPPTVCLSLGSEVEAFCFLKVMLDMVESFSKGPYDRCLNYSPAHGRAFHFRPMVGPPKVATDTAPHNGDYNHLRRLTTKLDCPHIPTCNYWPYPIRAKGDDTATLRDACGRHALKQRQGNITGHKEQRQLLCVQFKLSDGRTSSPCENQGQKQAKFDSFSLQARTS